VTRNAKATSSYHEETYLFLYLIRFFCYRKGNLNIVAVLGPTQPPIQRVSGALSLWVKRSGREADHSPPSSAEDKECVELYFHSSNMSPWRVTIVVSPILGSKFVSRFCDIIFQGDETLVHR
jgi:hypothetical protein